MNIEFDRMTSLSINGKVVQTLNLNGNIIYPAIDFKTLKCDLSGYTILGIADNTETYGYYEAAVVKDNGNQSYTFKTFDIDDGTEASSFTESFSGMSNINCVAFFDPFSKIFWFVVGYYSSSTSGWYWKMFTEDGYQYWTSPGGQIIGFDYGEGAVWTATTSGLTISFDYMNPNGGGYGSNSYTINTQGVNSIVSIIAVGTQAVVKANYTPNTNYPYIFSINYKTSAALSYNGNSGITFTTFWDDPTDSNGLGYYNTTGNVLFSNMSIISGTTINSNYSPLKNGAVNSKIYLKGPNNSFYKLENGTYTTLGEYPSGVTPTLLSKERNFWADTSGKIYYFPV